MHIPFAADFNIQIRGQCIDNRGAHTMKTTAGFICRVIKFSSCMQRSKNKTLRRDPFFMHTYRNSSSVILYRGRSVFLQCYTDPAAITGQMFIYRIIYNFINQMIQTFSGNTSDIHTGTFPHSLQSFQNCNAAGIIRVLFCHYCFLSVSFSSLFAPAFPKIHPESSPQQIPIRIPASTSVGKCTYK